MVFHCLRAEHSDLDAFAAAMPGFELCIRQLDQGPFASRMAMATTERVQLGYAQFERSLEMQGATPLGARTFVFSSKEDVTWTWRGRFVRGTDLLIYPRGSHVDILTPPGWGGYALSVEETFLATLLQQSELEEAALRKVEQLRWPKGALEPLRQLAAMVLDAPPGVDASEALEGQLPLAILKRIKEAEPSASVPESPRSLLVLRARDYIVRHAHEAPPVKAVLEAVGTSERTLRRAFHEHVGISPKAYVHAQRLNGVRAELRESGRRAGRVSDVAGRWGFWHMGQFAADYRRQFGELPSHTGRS